MTSHHLGTASRAAGPGPARGVALLLALLLTGCAGASGTTGRADVGSGREVAEEPPSAGRPEAPVRPATDAAPATPPGPERVVVPALGIDVPVAAAGVDDRGRMALPGSADEAAWYRFGAGPASPRGATVVAAHVDDEDSVGPFARLTRAEAGASVHVRTSDGRTYSYTVTQVRSEPKPDLSVDDLFDRSGPARLVLVTCGGTWDAAARSYSDNVVVTATPAG
ncbi:class F sortase [Promicromonospora sp. Marseille-Q5078]